MSLSGEQLDAIILFLLYCSILGISVTAMALMHSLVMAFTKKDRK